MSSRILTAVLLVLCLLSVPTARAQDARREAPREQPKNDVKIFSLRNSDAAEMVQTLRELFPPDAKTTLRIVVHKSTNSVLVRGGAEDVATIEAVIKQLDA